MTMQITMSPAGPPERDPRLTPARLRIGALRNLPPTALVLLSILSVQLGSALATLLFSSLGPAGTAWLSTGLSALVLTLVSRPQIDRRVRDHALLILLFGLADACVALPFFLALQYISLGLASTIAFLGPLGLALATSSRITHFLWVGVAALGIGLLTPDFGSTLRPIGLGLAALAGAGWAGFVPLSKRAGRVFSGNDGLTLGLWAAWLMLLPFALVEGTVARAGVVEIAGALAVALLNAVLPLALEFQALQRISARAYGILVTLEPAVGALVGALFLAQSIGLRTSFAIACVTVAAMGVTLFERRDG